MGLLLLGKRVCSYIKRAKRPLVFNLEVLIELRTSNSISKAIFYIIIKKKATKNLFGVCQDLLR